MGLNDNDITKLATLYWFTVEFGLLKQNGKLKAYGAGILSSVGEMHHACKEDEKQGKPPTYSKLDPVVTSETSYPITTFQTQYFYVNSLREAVKLIESFCENNISRPFYGTFDEGKKMIVSRDRVIKRINSV